MSSAERVQPVEFRGEYRGRVSTCGMRPESKACPGRIVNAEDAVVTFSDKCEARPVHPVLFQHLARQHVRLKVNGRTTRVVGGHRGSVERTLWVRQRQMA